MVGLKAGGKGALNKRTLVAAVAVLSFAGAASAQSANPFAFLFGGGAPREGRSAYVPAPAYVPPPSYGGSYASRPNPYGYSSLPGYSEPDYAPRQLRRPHPRSAPVERAHQDQSPKDVMAAIKSIKTGKGPLGPFVNDPTLRAGDVVVTAKGLMVYRGDGGPSHRESDFVSVSNASGLVANRQTLISLEKASRLTPQKPLGVEAKPSRRPAPEVASSATPKARSAR
jgi:hypothetical protein